MGIKKFIISLPERRDRHSAMQRQLLRIGWEDAQFFPAIRPTEDAGFGSVGVRGCFLSHLAALKAGLGHHVVLMEDDLNFSDDFSKQWVSPEQLPCDCSIFYPGHTITTSYPSGVQVLPATEKFRCAHFIVFRASIVPVVIDQLEEIMSKTPMHVDGAYFTIRSRNHNLKTYAHFPSLGYQRSSSSDITPSRFDRFAPLRIGVNALRNLKNIAFR